MMGKSSSDYKGLIDVIAVTYLILLVNISEIDNLEPSRQFFLITSF